MLSSFIALLMGGVAYVLSNENAQSILPDTNADVTPYVVQNPLPSKFEFTAYLRPDLDRPRAIKTPQGQRVNIQVLGGGNWTLPSGELLAIVLPNIGGEYGYVGNDDILRIEVMYTIQFVKDGSYGYVRWNGLGVLGVKNEGFVILETDSEENLGLATKLLYGQGVFLEKELVLHHYSFPRE